MKDTCKIADTEYCQQYACDCSRCPLDTATGKLSPHKYALEMTRAETLVLFSIDKKFIQENNIAEYVIIGCEFEIIIVTDKVRQ